jgi:hypothetical protein
MLFPIANSYLNDRKLVREVVGFCNEIADKMIAALGNELKISNPKVRRRYLTDLRYRCSHGGSSYKGMGVSIVLITPVIANGKQTYVNYPEYDHIKDDPEIGQIMAATWQQYCAALMAHEIAHAFQFYSSDSAEKFSARYAPSKSYQSKDGFVHGKAWQSIYRFLRVNFVNGVDFTSAVPAKVYRTKTYKIVGSVTLRDSQMIRVHNNRKIFLGERTTHKLIRPFKSLDQMMYGDEYGYVSILYGNKLCRIYGTRGMFDIYMDER